MVLLYTFCTVHISLYFNADKILKQKMVYVLILSAAIVKLQDAGWKEVIDSAVILYGPHDTRSYDCEEFLAAVQTALQSQAKVSDFVVSL